MPLIKVCGICKSYKEQKALENITFRIEAGQTLGLIGESGCGKTTLAKILLRLVKADSGMIFFNGENVFLANKSGRKKLRAQMQILFQDPVASLNPRMTVQQIIEEPLIIHKLPVERQAKTLLQLVQLPQNCLKRFPWQLSGGQCQRVALARALALKPAFIILDEPTSALDVSIQAQILLLLKALQKEMNLTYLFITHDLPVVRYIAANIAVMHRGKIIEMAPKHKLFNAPAHPYTRALLAAAKGEAPLLPTSPQIPLPQNICSFYNRCLISTESCLKAAPIWRQVDRDHFVLCSENGLRQAKTLMAKLRCFDKEAAAP